MTNKDMFKGTSVHGKTGRWQTLSKNMKIQPAEFINENKLLFCRRQCYKIYYVGHL